MSARRNEVATSRKESGTSDSIGDRPKANDELIEFRHRSVSSAH
jgi:hypothetical protein